MPGKGRLVHVTAAVAAAKTQRGGGLSATASRPDCGPRCAWHRSVASARHLCKGLPAPLNAGFVQSNCSPTAITLHTRGRHLADSYAEFTKATGKLSMHTCKSPYLEARRRLAARCTGHGHCQTRWDVSIAPRPRTCPLVRRATASSYSCHTFSYLCPTFSYFSTLFRTFSYFV